MAFIHRKKTGVWYLVDKSSKSVRWIKLGSVSKSFAKDTLLKYETDKNYLRLERPDLVPVSSVNFRELGEEYIKDVQGLKTPNTIKGEKGFISSLCRHFGNRKIGTIQAREVETYLQSQNYKPNSAHKYIMVFRAAYDYAVRQGYIDSNPMKAVRLPKIEQLPPRYVSPETIEKLFDTLRGSAQAYFMILYYTGMRPGEALRLQVKDIAADGIIIRHSKTKRFRVIPLHPKLEGVIEWLMKGKGQEDYLFPAKGGEGHVQSMKKALRIAVEKAGIKEKVSPYVFRHTFATQVLRHSKDLRATQVLLGHSKSAMTERYAHALPEALKKAVEGL